MTHHRNAQPAHEARFANAGPLGQMVAVTGWLRSICTEQSASVQRPGIHPAEAQGPNALGGAGGGRKSEYTDFQPHEFEDRRDLPAEGASERIVTAFRASIQCC